MRVPQSIPSPEPERTARPSLGELFTTEGGLSWLSRRLAVAVVLLMVGFGGYYSYDRYQVRAESPMDQAVRQLEDAVRQNPNDAEGRVRVANAYVRQKQYDQALAQYQEALKLRKDWQPALLAMAAAELARGNEARTEELYRQVAEMNKDSDYRYANRDLQVVYFRLATFVAKRAQHAEAEFWAGEALKVSRSDSDVLYLLGVSQEAQGKLAEAAEAYRRAGSYDPNFRESFVALQRVDLAQGNTREAAYARGMELLAAGDADGALGTFQQLAREAPDYAEAHQGLGLAYGKKGMHDDAQQAFRVALGRNPELVLAQWSLRPEGR